MNAGPCATTAPARRSDTLREAGLLLGGRVVTLAGAFACVKVMAGHLEPAQYGVIGLVNAVVALAFTLFQQPLGQSHGRYYLPHLEADQADLLGAAYRRLLLVASACGALLLALWAWWETAAGRLDAQAAAAFASIGALTVPLMAVWGRAMAALNLRRRQARQAAADSARSWLRVLVVLLVARLSVATPVAFLLGLLLVDALVLALVPWRSLGLGLGARTPAAHGALRDTQRLLLRFGTPFLLWGATGWLQTTSDRWIVDRLLSRADLGLYFLASQVASLVPGACAGVLVSLVTPRIYGTFPSAHERTRTAARQLLRACVVLGAIGLTTAAAALLGGEALLRWIGGRQYGGMGAVLVVLVLSQTAFHVAQVASTLALVEEVPARLLPVKFVGGLLSAGAMLAGGAHAGMWGVALGGAAGSVVYLLGVTLVVRRVARRHLGPQHAGPQHVGPQHVGPVSVVGEGPRPVDPGA